MLNTKTGWAVKVWRADGSHFFVPAWNGTALVWAKNDRKKATDYARHGVVAAKKRVVPVHYAHPVEIPKAKA